MLTKLRGSRLLTPNYCNDKTKVDRSNRGNCQPYKDFVIDRIKLESEGKGKVEGKLAIYFKGIIDKYKNLIEQEKKKPKPKPKPIEDNEVKKVFKSNIKSYNYKSSKDGKFVYISQSWWDSISQRQKDILNNMIAKAKPRKSSKEMMDELTKATQPTQPSTSKEDKIKKALEDSLKEKNNKDEEFINDVEKMVNSGSTRDYRSFKKKYKDDELIDNLFASQKWGDFYPTPQKCLESFTKDLNQYINKNDKILEPTAGIGSIVHFLAKKGYYNIEANELNKSMSNFLKKKYFNQKITNTNFLTTSYSNNSFSLVFCNPPFTNGGDSRFYMDFFFKCCEVIRQSKSGGEKYLYFISPKICEDEKKDSILTEHILSFISKVKLTKLFETHFKRKPKSSMFKAIKEGDEHDDIEEVNELLPDFIYLKDTCTGFAGTGTKANMYVCGFYNNPNTQPQPTISQSQPKPKDDKETSKTDKDKELEKDRQRLRIRKKKIIDSYLIEYYKIISNSSMELLEKSLKKGDIKDKSLRKAMKKNSDKHYKEFVKAFDDLGFAKGKMRVKWSDAVHTGKVNLLRIVSKHSNLFKRKLTNEQIKAEKEWLERNYPDVYKIVK